MENSGMIENTVHDALNWIVTTYQSEGLGGLLATIVIGGIFFGGMGFMFYTTAKDNARGIKKNEEQKDE